jgi:hypothetical protein
VTETAAAPKRRSPLLKLLPWVITIACFALLYTRIDGAAHRQGSSALPYLLGTSGSHSRSMW